MAPGSGRHRPVVPHGPLVVDTKDLDRRPGASHHLRTEVEAPAGLGSGLFSLPPGSPLVLDVRLDSVVEGVYVTARVEGRAEGECGYCLERDAAPVVVEIEELFEYADGRRVAAPAPDPDDEAALPSVVEGQVDLEPLVRDALVLELPFSRLCDDTCPRLPAAREHITDPDTVIDARWLDLRSALGEDLD